MRGSCCTGAGAAERSYPMSEVRGGGGEELPHVQGADVGNLISGSSAFSKTSLAQEVWEELLHVQDQEGPPWENTPPPR